MQSSAIMPAVEPRVRGARRPARLALALLALVTLVNARPASARWTADGTAVSSAAGPDSAAAIVSLGSGRSAVVWVEGAATRRVRARILDVDGAPTIPDTYLCTGAGSQGSPAAIADGAGGLIVAWEDTRNGATDIYAQRMDGSGNLLWGTAGVAACTATAEQVKPVLAGYGTGGAIVAWEDHRAGAGPAIVYAQRISPNATLTWTIDGIAPAHSPGPQLAPHIAPNGAGGAFLSWDDTNLGAGSPRVYAQALDTTGARWNLGAGSDKDADAYSGGNATANAITWDGATGAFVGFASSTTRWRVTHVDAAGALWASSQQGANQTTSRLLGLVPSTKDTVDMIFSYDFGSGVTPWRISVIRVIATGALGTGLTDMAQFASAPAPASVAAGSAPGAVVAFELGGRVSALRYTDTQPGPSSTPLPQLAWAAVPTTTLSTPVQQHPACILDDRNEPLVAWDDDRTGTSTPPNVFAQRFSPLGLAGAHRIVATAGAGGTSTPAGAFYVAHLGDSTVTLHSNSTFHITSLAVNGSDLGPRPNYRFHGVTADSTLTGTFATGPVSAGPVTGAGTFAAFTVSTPSQPLAPFTASLGAVDHTLWRLGHWNPVTSVYDEAGGALDSLRLGRGYWLITKSAASLDSLRGTASETDYSIPLQHPVADAPAWNQIGNPFRFAISDSDLAVQHNGGARLSFLNGSVNTYTDAVINGWDPVNGYVPTHRLEPGRAYWVHYLAGNDVRLVYPCKAPANGYAPDPVGPVPDGADWAIAITAERAGLAPGRLVVGTAAVVPDEWNRYCGARLPKSPAPSCDVYVSHVAWGRASGDYVADFAAPAPLQAWELNVGADGALASGALAFHFAGVPSGARVRLVDAANGWARDIADGERVELALGETPRALRLEVATGSGVTLSAPAARTVFRCAAPSPFAERTALVFALGERAEFALEIFDVGGRRVHAVTRGMLPAGEHVEVWDGRADDGQRAAPGVYMARWRAGGAGGTARLVRIP